MGLQHIKRRREELGLSREDLARAGGISRPALSQIEGGATKNLRGKTLSGFAKLLNWTPEQVLGGPQATAAPKVPVAPGTRQENELLTTYRNLPKKSRDVLMYISNALLMAASPGPGPYPFKKATFGPTSAIVKK